MTQRHSQQTIRRLPRSVTRLFPWVSLLPPHISALSLREWRSLSRDFTQALQIVPILAVVFMYLLQLRFFGVASSYREELQNWWQTFLVLGNIALSSFILLAVCSRFVFPRISMEGNRFWIIQKAPLTIHRYLRSLFWICFIPLFAIQAIITGAGALAVQAHPRIIFLSMGASGVILFGLVGVAIGASARYAEFRWETSSQVTSSYGNLIFLISGLSTIVLGFLPLSALLILRTARLEGIPISSLTWYTLVISLTTLLVLGNYFLRHYSLRRGEQVLLDRLANTHMF